MPPPQASALSSFRTITRLHTLVSNYPHAYAPLPFMPVKCMQSLNLSGGGVNIFSVGALWFIQITKGSIHFFTRQCKRRTNINGSPNSWDMNLILFINLAPKINWPTPFHECTMTLFPCMALSHCQDRNQLSWMPCISIISKTTHLQTSIEQLKEILSPILATRFAMASCSSKAAYLFLLLLHYNHYFSPNSTQHWWVVTPAFNAHNIISPGHSFGQISKIHFKTSSNGALSVNPLSLSIMQLKGSCNLYKYRDKYRTPRRLTLLPTYLHPWERRSYSSSSTACPNKATSLA